MHWLVSGVVHWLAVCVAGGRGPCLGSVRLVAYVYSWVGGPFCLAGLEFCWSGICASRLCAVLGQGGAGGGWDAVMRMDTPISKRRENETPTVFVLVEVLRSSHLCSLVRHFFRNHETFITDIQGENTLLSPQTALNVAITKQMDLGRSLVLVTSPPVLLQHNPKF